MKNRTTEDRPVILAVDDDIEWLEFISVALDESFRVEVSSDAEEALRMVDDLAPVAILLDVVMPGRQDGFAAFCELQKRESTRDIPVLMFSQINEITGAGFDEGSMKSYLGHPPAAFLEKPMTAAALRDAVEAVLAGSD